MPEKLTTQSTPDYRVLNERGEQVRRGSSVEMLRRQMRRGWLLQQARKDTQGVWSWVTIG